MIETIDSIKLRMVERIGDTFLGYMPNNQEWLTDKKNQIIKLVDEFAKNIKEQ